MTHKKNNRYIQEYKLINIILQLCVLVIAVLLPMPTFAQTTFDLYEDLTFDFSKTKLEVSNKAKHKRASKRSGGGRILINYVIADSVPNEYYASIDVAKSIWEDYLPYGDTILIDVSFVDNLSNDMSINKLYQLENKSNTYYPAALRKKLSDEFMSTYDAKIYINKNTNWTFGIGEENAYTPKNLTLAFMQCICRSLGFGSSVKASKRGVEFKAKNYTIFDKYIKNDKGNYLIDFISNRTGLQQFSTGELGDVYFSSNDVIARLYAPAAFNGDASLKYTTKENSLMDVDIESKTQDLVIDDLTLNILNETGWNFIAPDKLLSIISDDIDSTGVASAYKSHCFHITPNADEFDKMTWKLLLPLYGGSFATICSSHSPTFTIEAISNPNLYEHTIEGDIRGIITFEGLSNGTPVSLSRPITLELKPRILSADVIATYPNNDNAYYFDAVVEIKYEGSHYLHAFVEEEHSDFLTSYYSSTPYYTKLVLTNIASWGDAWFDITVRNEYGYDNYVLDLSYNDKANKEKSCPNTITDTNKMERVKSNVTHIDVYNMQGQLVSTHTSYPHSLSKGLYMLKFYDIDGNCHKEIKLCINQ